MCLALMHKSSSRRSIHKLTASVPGQASLFPDWIIASSGGCYRYGNVQGTFQCRHGLGLSARAFPVRRQVGLGISTAICQGELRLHMTPGLTGTPVLNTTSKEQMPSVAEEMLLAYANNRSPFAEEEHVHMLYIIYIYICVF